MAETIREQIISAIMTRVETIKTANGYNSECGQSVHRAIKDLETGDIPAVVVWPQIEEIERKYGKNTCTTQVKLEAFMAFGVINASEIQEKLLGDLVTSMTNPASPVTPLVDDLYYKEGGPAGQPDSGEIITGVSATFEIKYTYQIGNPYAQ